MSTGYLQECGADYVTVFQETYDADKYETLHLMGHKRVWPYRFEAQERALMGGMRGVGFSALLGLADFRKDALASCPARLLSPAQIPPRGDVPLLPAPAAHRQQRQDQSAWTSMKSSSVRSSARTASSCPSWASPSPPGRAPCFRDGIVKIAATKVSAGVSTGIGDHESKYSGKDAGAETGDEQFEINDGRSFATMYEDMSGGRACSRC